MASGYHISTDPEHLKIYLIISDATLKIEI